MLGKRWLGHVKRLAELLHRKLGLVQFFENTSASRVCHRPKNPILTSAPHAGHYIAEWLCVKEVCISGEWASWIYTASGEDGDRSNFPSHFATTTVARQLPITFTAVRAMSIN
jgi:hypothetical protein